MNTHTNGDTSKRQRGQFEFLVAKVGNNLNKKINKRVWVGSQKYKINSYEPILIQRHD